MEANAADSLAEFYQGKWYQAHITEERHHINDRCPDGITLIDIIEMIVDNTVAAMARSGRKPEIPIISNEVLHKAYVNTFELLINEIILEDDYQVSEAGRAFESQSL